jgi:hypothetical protein
MTMTPNTTGLLPELGNGSVAPTSKDDVLDAAIKAGKFSAARRAHYAAEYDRNPERTVRLVAALKTGAVAPESTGPGTGLLPELG